MAYFEVGSFTSPTSGSSQTVNLTGSFTPTAVIIWSSRTIAAGDNGTASTNIGFSDGATEFGIAQYIQDGVGAFSAGRITRDSCLITIINPGNIREEATVSAFAAGSFSLAYDTNHTSAYLYNYCAFGDASAKVIAYETDGTTGNDPITGF